MYFWVKDFHLIDMNPLKILVAEDERLLLKTMVFFLEKKGYLVVAVSDGELAREKIRTESFDLIITDINMPYASGMELLHLVRNELKLQTPVIVLTSASMEKVALDAFEMGASEFVSKPFSLPVLAARIEKLTAT